MAVFGLFKVDIRTLPLKYKTIFAKNGMYNNPVSITNIHSSLNSIQLIVLIHPR